MKNLFNMLNEYLELLSMATYAAHYARRGQHKKAKRLLAQ